MNTQFRLKNHLMLVALAAAYPAFGNAAGAARVEFVSGPVVAITPTGAQRELLRGIEVRSGETVRTGDNARLQLRFSDGAVMSLQPKTEFRIDDYRYSGKDDGEERGFFSLVKGGLRTITGLVGRSNRDNYRVTTSVATIGIRGTEYSAVISNTASTNETELNLSTGEGRVEVCNAGGCVIVAGGQSAVVTGTTPPIISPIRAISSSSTSGSNATAQVVSTPLAPYSTSENIDSEGKPVAVPAALGLVSGSDYVLAYAENESGLVYGGLYDPAIATFSTGSKLEKFTNGTDTHTADTVTAAFSVDGILGWGSWSSGVKTGTGDTPLTDVHYVIGKPSSASDLQGLNGYVGTYTMIGFTTPTSTLGGAATSFNATLVANFGGAYTTVDASVSMTFAAGNVTATTTGMQTDGAGTFSGGSSELMTPFGTNGGVNIHGFFAGAGASHAGITYAINAGGSIGDIAGAAAFKQTNIQPASPH